MGKPIQQHHQQRELLQQQQGKKPPYFRECPICHREFGSRSLEIHKSRCLERQKSSSDQESDSIEQITTSPIKAPKPKMKAPLSKIKSVKNSSPRKNIVVSDDDDEVETSLSDELNHSWPATKPRGPKRLNLSRTLIVKNRRKRERKKERSEANTSSGDEGGVEGRPKTATLKRPHILDESLKDKVDMTLTKKEFLAAVKLCSDVAVQRGLPNMRPKKIQGKVKGSKEGFQGSSSSPYTKLLGKFKKVKPESTKIVEVRPKTTKLDKPSQNVDLPHINTVKPQIVVSKSLSRHMKIRNKIKKTIEDTKKEPEIRLNLLGKQKTINANTKSILLPKDKVPEPCKSCGRSDFPERLHTHNDNNNKTPSKQKEKQQQPSNHQPWLSPKTNNPRTGRGTDSRQRALSLDHTSTLTDQELGNQKLYGGGGKKLQRPPMKGNSMASLRLVDISDEILNSDVEMSNNENEDKNVIVSEVKAVPTAKKSNNKESKIIIDDSSSANESSSEKPKDFKKSKRPPPPQIKSSPSKGTETEVKKVPEVSTENPEINDNNNLLGLVNCAVCGKQFGKNSIKFHLRQCQKKQQLIKGRQEKIEESAKQQTEEDEESVPYIHEAIWTAHVQQLIPCGNCGRTFFPDRIKVHQKSCKGLTVKVVPPTGPPASTSSPTAADPSSSQQQPLLPNSTNQQNTVVPNKDSSNLDLFSPSMIRRTLHSQDDTVVSNTGPNYEETMIKQLQKTE